MKRLNRFLLLSLLAGAAMAAGGGPLFAAATTQSASLPDMERELEALDRQEAALTAWLADVENIVRPDANGRGDPQETLYTPAYIDAMQRSLAAVREKRQALTRAVESERRRPGAGPN